MEVVAGKLFVAVVRDVGTCLVVDVCLVAGCKEHRIGAEAGAKRWYD